MENNLIASKANYKLANVPSGIANSAQRSTLNLLHIPPNGGVLYRQAQENENHERSSVSDLSVYPNPSSGIINIEFVEWNNDEYYVLELYSSIGKGIDKFWVQSKSTQLDLSKYQLGTGLLLYRCYNSKGVVINSGKISYIKH